MDLIFDAIELADERLRNDMPENLAGEVWLNLREIAFDDCLEDAVYARFEWVSPETGMKPEKGEVAFYKDDFRFGSPHWLAGMIYAKVLETEHLF